MSQFCISLKRRIDTPLMQFLRKHVLFSCFCLNPIPNPHTSRCSPENPETNMSQFFESAKMLTFSRILFRILTQTAPENLRTKHRKHCSGELWISACCIESHCVWIVKNVKPYNRTHIQRHQRSVLLPTCIS